MAIAKVFKNRVLNCNVSTPEGRIITFIEGHHITTNKKDIEFLEKEITEGNNSFLYVDPDNLEVDTDELSEEGRIAKIKRLAVEEYIKTNEANKVTTSTQGELNPGTSATVNPTSIQSLSSAASDSVTKETNTASIVSQPANEAKVIVPGSLKPSK